MLFISTIYLINDFLINKSKNTFSISSVKEVTQTTITLKVGRYLDYSALTKLKKSSWKIKITFDWNKAKRGNAKCQTATQATIITKNY